MMYNMKNVLFVIKHRSLRGLCNWTKDQRRSHYIFTAVPNSLLFLYFKLNININPYISETISSIIKIKSPTFPKKSILFLNITLLIIIAVTV